MYVTVRMCCAYWDNDGVKRPWKKPKGKQAKKRAFTAEF